MANLMTVRLNKGDSPSWGFRLQGGKDFGAPLVIQKVNGGSPAERAGLIAGDCVIKVNNTDVFNLRHKDAQDVIVRAGPSFDVTVQRGGSTWKPTVIPTGSLASPKPNVPVSNISPVTKTSLTAPKSDNWGSVGTGHNVSAKPFAGGAVNGVGPKLVNKQYNSPVNLYSEDTIAETLSAQAEVLANGVLGVNFKKNEKTYDASKSNVLRYVKEDEQEPKSPEPAHDFSDAGVVVTSPSALGVAGLRAVRAPENKPAPSNPTLPPGQNICAECERLIVGVFVRIKEKNLHVECFKCSTCGTSLKNVGYYNINNKLYCDVHAKLAARNNPSVTNLAPVSIPPAGRPVGGVSPLSPNSLPSSAPLSPNINSYAPPPFQSGPNLSGPRPFSGSSGPLSPSGNSYSTLPKALSTPLSSDCNTSLNIVWPPPPSGESEVPTACPIYLPPPSQVKVKTIDESYFKKKTQKHSIENYKVDLVSGNEKCELFLQGSNNQRLTNLESSDLSELNGYFPQDEMSYTTKNTDQYSSHQSEASSISGRKSTQECVEILSEAIDNQIMVESVMKTRPLFIDTDEHLLNPNQPMWEAKSVLKEGSYQQADSQLSAKSELTSVVSASAVETSTKEEKKEVISSKTQEIPSTCSIKLNRYTKKVENAVPHEYESPMVLALTVASDKPFSQMQVEITKSETTKLDNVSDNISASENVTTISSTQSSTEMKQVTASKVEQVEQKFQQEILKTKEEISTNGKSTFEEIPEKWSSSAFTNALIIAPAEPFGISQMSTEPVPLPEETKPYFPPSDLFVVKINSKTEEEIKKAEKISRFRKKKDELDEYFKDLPTPTQKIDLLSALTTAPDRPFSPSIEITEEESTEKSSKINISEQTHNQEKQKTKSSVAKSITSSATSNSIVDSKMKEEHKKNDICTTKDAKISETAARKATSKVSSTTTKTKSDISQQNKADKTKLCTLTEKKAADSIYFNDQKIDYSTSIENKSQKNVLPEKPLVVTEYSESVKTINKASEVPTKYSKIPKLVPEIKTSEYKEVNISQISTSQKKVQEEFHASQFSTHGTSQTPAKVPIVAIKQDNLQNNNIPKTHFKPVSEETPPNKSFSPRPGSLTPSMINRAPPLIPVYQTMLVPTECLAAPTNVFDPSNPQISRSPSPGPGRTSSLSGRISPIPSKMSVRPMSPAVGPPINPLDIINPKPKSDPQIIEAKSNIASAYKKNSDNRIKEVKAAKYALEKVSSDIESSVHKCELGNTQKVSQAFKAERGCEKQLQEQLQSRSELVEVSGDDNIQIQRRKKVIEEYEHSQKSKEMIIAKSTLTTKSKLVDGDAQVAVSGMHVTNPQPLKNPFQPRSITETTNLPTPSVCIKDEFFSKEEEIQVKNNRNACQKKKTCTSPSNIPKLVRTKSFPTSDSSPKPYIPPPSCENVTKPDVSLPNTGSGSGRQVGAIGLSPKRGRGVLNLGGGSRVPLCGQCHKNVRGPFVTALGKIWCPEHFSCSTPSCRRPLQDLGFVEEQGQLYCEYCFERYLAPNCAKCAAKIKAECLKAIGKHFHPECFNCVYCGKLFGNNPFFLEDGQPYCENDWNELFTTKCFACGFPIEAGDRWVEALSNNYHSQCFNCTMCKKNLEGQSFFAKGGRPFCKNHAR